MESSSDATALNHQSSPVTSSVSKIPRQKAKRKASGLGAGQELRFDMNQIDAGYVLQIMQDLKANMWAAKLKFNQDDRLQNISNLRQLLPSLPANLQQRICQQLVENDQSSGQTAYDKIELAILAKQRQAYFDHLYYGRISKRIKLQRKIDELRTVLAEKESSSIDDERTKIWKHIVRKQIPKVAKQMSQTIAARMFNAKRVASVCSRETKRLWARQNRISKEANFRARKEMREMLAFWKKNEREEKELRKRAEKEAAEQRRIEEEQREAKRQAKKLNFLLTQTELFTHFIANKPQQHQLTSTAPSKSLEAGVDFADVDDDVLRAQAEKLALAAAEKNREKVQAFNTTGGDRLDFSKAEVSSNVLQPRMLQATLKEYQLKGLGWLANLYEQGINGILADEMGLGKTIQAISLLAHLAESHNIWGPFLVVAPASTLHNWQQELSKFVPTLKAMPYWGNVADRKMLRKFWPSTSKRPFTRDSTFHIMITSYQLVVTDQAFLQKIRWQYMILDEAQAIKSSSSQRWKVLLGFPCRNRLLLTGTPIQNTMQELWALLHFIMPSLFDSHDEFSDWFSKDIESTAASETKSSSGVSGFDQHQLSRLHMLLKPFMLRRVKKDVQSELAPKVELEIACELAPRQRRLYRAIKQRLPIAELLKTVASSSSEAEAASASLMNIVMQFRKVCNHPELFERDPILSPFVWHSLGSISPKEEKGNADINWGGPLDNPINMTIPRLLIPTELPPRRHVDQLPTLDTLLLKERENPFSDEDLIPISFRFIQDRIPTMYVPAVVAPPIRLEASSSPWTTAQETKMTDPKVLNSLATRPLDYSIGRKIILPDFEKAILGCGKMAKLDTLLAQLKTEGHRVLIYNQMTKMIDMMEEYLEYRGYRYLRLDGSTKISDRRDMVNDWQSTPDIFVFLLSTRAGGLGINLTAADTVIFYDSDWNPTVDQQAMDRAHRLGQTKQVTVYRLLTKGSIEERIQQRAHQKDLVQKVVIAGGEFQQDTTASSQPEAGPMRAKDIASLLLDEDESGALEKFTSTATYPMTDEAGAKISAAPRKSGKNVKF